MIEISKETLLFILDKVEDCYKKECEKIIKKLSYKYVNTYGRVSQHRKSEESLIDKINELIDEVNKKNKN